MPVLCWDKPKKILSNEDWQATSFEDGPKGGYVPNMSADDARLWRACLKGTRTGYPQVEIRVTLNGHQMVIIVSLGAGYSYKGWKPQAKYECMATQGINVHMSLNGPARMTFEQMTAMHEAVAEARAALEALPATVARKAE